MSLCVCDGQPTHPSWPHLALVNKKTSADFSTTLNTGPAQGVYQGLPRRALSEEAANSCGLRWEIARLAPGRGISSPRLGLWLTLQHQCTRPSSRCAPMHAYGNHAGHLGCFWAGLAVLVKVVPGEVCATWPHYCLCPLPLRRPATTTTHTGASTTATMAVLSTMAHSPRWAFAESCGAAGSSPASPIQLLPAVARLIMFFFLLTGRRGQLHPSTSPTSIQVQPRLPGRRSTSARQLSGTRSTLRNRR